MEKMLEEDGISLPSLPPLPLSPLLSSGSLSSHRGSSSGGYADFVLVYLARTIYGIELENIEWKKLRSVLKKKKKKKKKSLQFKVSKFVQRKLYKKYSCWCAIF